MIDFLFTRGTYNSNVPANRLEKYNVAFIYITAKPTIFVNVFTISVDLIYVF